MADLARRHRARLERFAYRMLHDRAAAEDVAQETLIRLWGSASAYRPEGRFLAYLYTLARNRCLSHVGVSGSGWARARRRRRRAVRACLVVTAHTR